MNSIAKLLLLAYVVPTAMAEAAPAQGFLEGHLKIFSIRAVGESDDMPRAATVPPSYAEFPLVVLSQDRNNEIERMIADKDGNYRVALAPGSYILDLKDRAAKHLRAKPQPFTIESDQTVHVDINVMIGFGIAR